VPRQRQLHPQTHDRPGTAVRERPLESGAAPTVPWRPQATLTRSWRTSPGATGSERPDVSFQHAGSTAAAIARQRDRRCARPARVPSRRHRIEAANISADTRAWSIRSDRRRLYQPRGWPPVRGLRGQPRLKGPPTTAVARSTDGGTYPVGRSALKIAEEAMVKRAPGLAQRPACWEFRARRERAGAPPPQGRRRW
jgi:hypothetical protein